MRFLVVLYFHKVQQDSEKGSIMTSNNTGGISVEFVSWTGQSENWKKMMGEANANSGSAPYLGGEIAVLSLMKVRSILNNEKHFSIVNDVHRRDYGYIVYVQHDSDNVSEIIAQVQKIVDFFANEGAIMNGTVNVGATEVLVQDNFVAAV